MHTCANLSRQVRPIVLLCRQEFRLKNASGPFDALTLAATLIRLIELGHKYGLRAKATDESFPIGAFDKWTLKLPMMAFKAQSRRIEAVYGLPVGQLNAPLFRLSTKSVCSSYVATALMKSKYACFS